MIFNIKKNIIKKRKNNSGYSLIEFLFYISLFIVFSLVIINSMIVITKAFREISLNRDIMQASFIIDRMSRDIREAENVISINQNGVNLKLNIKEENQNYKTILYKLNGTNIELFENNLLIGNLNSSDISITNLEFTPITNTEIKMIKIFMTVKSNNYNSIKTENFYNSIFLRNAF